MAGSFTQQLIPFGEPQSHAEAARYQPGAETLAAVARLRLWLADPRTGRMTDFAGEILRAVEKALIEGKNGWWHKAEEGLEGLLLRNGNRQGDDIPADAYAAGDFHHVLDDLLDCLHERFAGRGR